MYEFPHDCADSSDSHLKMPAIFDIAYHLYMVNHWTQVGKEAQKPLQLFFFQN